MRTRVVTAERDSCVLFGFFLSRGFFMFSLSVVFGVCFFLLSLILILLKASKLKGLQSECNPAYHCLILIHSEIFEYILYINNVLLKAGLLCSLVLSSFSSTPGNRSLDPIDKHNCTWGLKSYNAKLVCFITSQQHPISCFI